MEIQQIVVKGPNIVELEISNVNENNIGSNELLIETEYTFISAGTELANYTGNEPRVFQSGSWCAYPWRSGYANVGIVRRIGDGVTRAKPGDRVFSYGNHASVVCYDESRLVVVVPEDVEPSIAAASRMAGVATTAVIVSEVTNDPLVVIFGLGMVGNLAAQSFCIKGCRVIGVDPVDKRRELADKCGVPYTIGGEPDEVQKSIEEITHGKMGNITVDAVGHSSVVMQALRATANYGQLIILGTPRVPVYHDLTKLLSDVHLRWITIRGALEWCLPMYSGTENIQSQHSKQQMIFDWIRRGQLTIDPLISHRLKPEQIRDAYEGLLNKPEIYTGVVLDWRQS